MKVRRSRRAPAPTPGSASAWRLHALVTLSTVAVFARAVPYPLHASWDDGRFIIDNPLVRAPSLDALRSIWSAPHYEAYHPLHLLGYWLDVPFVGAHGPTLHAVNLVLWALALNLLLRVFLALGLGAAPALLGTLACGLHPIQVEAVSWATGRKDVLALLLSSAAVLCHLRATHWLDTRAWLARLCFVFAALAKTTALPLPFVLVLIDVLLRGRRPREALLHQAPSLVLGAGLGAGVLAIWSQNAMIRGGAGGAGSLPSRVTATVGHQLGTALWPSTTSPMYATQALSAPDALDLLAIAAIVLLCVVAYVRGNQRALFALGAFGLFLLPVSNAVAMYFPFQDRYLSLPLIGLAFGFGAALDAWHARFGGRLAVLVGAGFVLALALRCVQYQGAWASETRLWGHAASTQPDAYYAFMKLGEVRRREGDLHGSMRAYRELLRIDPSRKVGYAALLQSTALRDERLRGLSPSRAEQYARQYYDGLDDPDALLALSSRMLASGHLRTVELPLERALELRPVPDAALERAAEFHFEAGRPTLGAFYLRRMRTPTQRQGLRAQAARVAQP